MAPKKKSPSFTSINPATGETIHSSPFTELTQVPELFQKARNAQKEWANRPISQRSKYLLAIRDYIRDNSEKISQDISRNSGKSPIEALATEVVPSALAADWYAKNGPKLLRPYKIPRSSILFLLKRNQIHRLPLGIVGIISPWNYPFSIAFHEILMALIAGNAVMFKGAPQTGLVNEIIENILTEAGLPDDLFNQIIHEGPEVSKAFFDNGIDKLFFTGSVGTGKVLMRQAAESLTPVSLELGGKDPMIVLADADLERASNGALWAGLQNAGQSCGGVERIYVEQKVYEPFLKLLSQKIQTLRQNDNRDWNQDIGAFATKEQMETVKKQVDQAVKKGAQIVAQSQSKVSKNSKGFFYPATLLVQVDHSMNIMREENFGPVLPVMPFQSIDEAVKLANDSTMALTSSIWTQNFDLGKKLALRLESGVTTINDHLYTHGQTETPWGGWKNSGIGRTHGSFGLEEMTHIKLINWDIFPTPRMVWWFPYNKSIFNLLQNTLFVLFGKSLGHRVKALFRIAGPFLKQIFTK